MHIVLKETQKMDSLFGLVIYDNSEKLISNMIGKLQVVLSLRCTWIICMDSIWLNLR